MGHAHAWMGAIAADATQVLLIGGRSGVGKPPVAYAISAQLHELGVAHCHVEGDNPDAAYPKPADDPSGTGPTEANPATLWRNYAARGYRTDTSA